MALVMTLAAGGGLAYSFVTGREKPAGLSRWQLVIVAAAGLVLWLGGH